MNICIDLFKIVGLGSIARSYERRHRGGAQVRSALAVPAKTKKLSLLPKSTHLKKTWDGLSNLMRKGNRYLNSVRQNKINNTKTKLTPSITRKQYRENDYYSSYGINKI